MSLDDSPDWRTDWAAGRPTPEEMRRGFAEMRATACMLPPVPLIMGERTYEALLEYGRNVAEGGPRKARTPKPHTRRRGARLIRRTR